MLSPDQYRLFQRTRWTIFVILVMAYMMAFFHRMAPAVVAGELRQAFHTTGAEPGVRTKPTSPQGAGQHAVLVLKQSEGWAAGPQSGRVAGSPFG